MSTAYLFDENYLWHEPSQFAQLVPVGGYVQGGAGHPDCPKTKRRLYTICRPRACVSSF